MRFTSATVRLSALVENYKFACRLSPAANSLAVVKANGYGHGAVAVARALAEHAPAFGVVTIDEALELRSAGIAQPILLLQGVNTVEEVREAAAADLWLMVTNREQFDAIINSRLDGPIVVWLKVDTGMHRLGLSPDEFHPVLAAALSSSKVHPDLVACTHLACADDLANPFTSQQVELLRALVSGRKLAVSIANSAAIMRWPVAHAEWNRPGYMLYGNCPLGGEQPGEHGLRPIMTLTSQLLAVRDIAEGEGVGYGHRWRAKRASRIGTIAIGYGDGYPRHATNGTPVMINGRGVPLVGTVSMDSITVDLSDLPSAAIGDPVELWGENLSVNQVAASAGTIGYELLAGLTGRVPLVYER